MEGLGMRVRVTYAWGDEVVFDRVERVEIVRWDRYEHEGSVRVRRFGEAEGGIIQAGVTAFSVEPYKF